MIRFLRLMAAFSSGDPSFHARGPPPPSRRQCRVHIPGGAARLSRCRVRLGMKPTAFVELWPPSLAHPGPMPGSMIRFLRLIAAFRFRSWVVPQLGQVHMRSRFSFAFTVPHTLQVLLLGNHMGASHLGVPPLALSVSIACQRSISAPPGAGLGFPRERPPTFRNAAAPGCLATWGNRAGR